MNLWIEITRIIAIILIKIKLDLHYFYQKKVERATQVVPLVQMIDQIN